jgi:hypothetical protein
LATGVPGKTDFGLLGWNSGASGNSTDPAACIEIKKKQA